MEEIQYIQPVRAISNINFPGNNHFVINLRCQLSMPEHEKEELLSEMEKYGLGGQVGEWACDFLFKFT